MDSYFTTLRKNNYEAIHSVHSFSFHLASSRLIAISAIISMPIQQKGVVFNQRDLQDSINR